MRLEFSRLLMTLPRTEGLQRGARTRGGPAGPALLSTDQRVPRSRRAAVILAAIFCRADRERRPSASAHSGVVGALQPISSFHGLWLSNISSAIMLCSGRLRAMVAKPDELTDVVVSMIRTTSARRKLERHVLRVLTFTRSHLPRGSDNDSAVNKIAAL